MRDKPEIWPRIRDLPADERGPFLAWLRGQTAPMIEIGGTPLLMSEQDGYYPWDYERWRTKKPTV